MGIRLDSGDLAYLSCESRKFFRAVEKDFGVPGFEKMSITASNDLNEETLDALNKQVILQDHNLSFCVNFCEVKEHLIGNGSLIQSVFFFLLPHLLFFEQRAMK